MVSYGPQGIISVIAFNLLEPITTLLATLDSQSFAEPNEVQASPIDNGYSISVIVLGVLLLESAINRTQYIQGASPPIRSAIKFIKSAYPNFADDIQEVFVVRDVIAHNHIWEGAVGWDSQLNLKSVSDPTRTKGYGDAKFDSVLNPDTRKTRRLHINLVPIRVCRADAVIVLKKVVEFLLFLERQDRNYVYISPQFVIIDRNPVSFVDYIVNLQE